MPNPCPPRVTGGLLALLVVVLAGCGESSTEPTSATPPNGRFEGSVTEAGRLSSVVVVMEIATDAIGRVTGTLRTRRGISFGPEFEIAGRFDTPIIQLYLSEPGGAELTLLGEVDDVGSMIEATYIEQGLDFSLSIEDRGSILFVKKAGS